MPKSSTDNRPIKFVNAMPGFAEAHPIILAKDYKRDWIEKNAKHLHAFQEELKKCYKNNKKDAFGRPFCLAEAYIFVYMYNTSFSLDKLRDDPDFAALFAKKAVDIKKNKADLVEAAKSYQTKYKKEIAEGTRKRHLMLTEGKEKGLKEEDIFKNNQIFIPTEQTPILNFLYFMLCEQQDTDAAIKVLRAAEDLDKELSVLKEEFEKKYGAEVHKDHDTPNDVPNMMSFVYKNIGDDTFSTIKKLKTLTMSENEQEAFIAFRKCMELCKKYNLEFSQIPVNR